MADDSSAGAAAPPTEPVPTDAPAVSADATPEAGAATTAASEATGKKAKRWFPLESSPPVMNKYIERLGFPTTTYQFCDVLATEDWALGMVPQPVKAVMLLFPIKESSEKHRDEEAARIASEGQVVSDKLYYTKQTVGNACGTVGLIHSVANCSTYTGGDVELVEGKFWDRFLARTLTMSADERADALEEDEEIEVAHEATAQEGQSEVVQDVMTHFVAFVEKDGHLYELDGRKATPINHGPSSPATLLQDAVKVIKQFMERDPGELRFGITCLAAPGDM